MIKREIVIMFIWAEAGLTLRCSQRNWNSIIPQFQLKADFDRAPVRSSGKQGLSTQQRECEDGMEKQGKGKEEIGGKDEGEKSAEGRGADRPR